MANPIEKYIGQGLIFPIVLVNGRPPLATGFELLRSSIKIILSWPYGTRFFLPEFGSMLDQLIAEPNDVVLKGLIQDLVIDAIKRWETRVELLQATITDINDDSIYVQLNYQIRNSKVVDSFVFPFYKTVQF